MLQSSIGFTTAKYWREDEKDSKGLQPSLEKDQGLQPSLEKDKGLRPSLEKDKEL